MPTPLFADYSDFHAADPVALKAFFAEYKAITEQMYDDLQTQITNVANMLSDDVLTPGEKPIWIALYTVLSGEQAGLSAQGLSYGITTARTNYNNAVTALTTHLNTLTSAVDWDDMSGNTTIVGTTFRSKFTDVLTTKQALINAITAAAKALADAAQADADQAAIDAAAADAAAAAAQADADTAGSTADTAKRDDAISASSTAPSAILTASDPSGTGARITIAAHDRIYGDGIVRAINSGTINSLSYSTTYAVYYDDTGRTAGTKTFVATTTLKNAQYNFAAGRHFCGQVTTPAMGGGATSPTGPGIPGGGGPYP